MEIYKLKVRFDDAIYVPAVTPRYPLPTDTEEIWQMNYQRRDFVRGGSSLCKALPESEDP